MSQLLSLQARFESRLNEPFSFPTDFASQELRVSLTRDEFAKVDSYAHDEGMDISSYARLLLFEVGLTSLDCVPVENDVVRDFVLTLYFTREEWFVLSVEAEELSVSLELYARLHLTWLTPNAIPGHPLYVEPNR